MDPEVTGAGAARPPLAARIGRILFLVLAGAVVIAVAVAFFVAWTIHRSFPQTTGTIELDGLEAPVTVQRDAQGVPTVTASSAHDLFFAQGYTHAQDRFFEMDFRRHVTSGRVSEMFGASQVETDAFLRTLGWHRIAEQEVAALDDTTRGYYDAYAEGVNAYIASHEGAGLSLEYAVIGLQNPGYRPEPWEPADSVAWLKAMAWDLRTNIEDEIDRAALAAAALAAGETDVETMALLETMYPSYPYERNPVIVPRITPAEELTGQHGTAPAASLAPAADDEAGAQAIAAIDWQQASGVVEAASMLVGGVGEGIGSNSWVVSGDLTESGSPLLANDPHLGASLPSVWYQMQLKCSAVGDACPFDLGGYSFSGLPGIVIGHNADIAWGLTNLNADVTDLYVEKVDGDRYWRDGVREPLEIEHETITVAGGDDVPLTIRRTAHGPIISGLFGPASAIADDPVAPQGDTLPVAPGSTESPPGEFAVSLRWTALDPGTTASAIFALATASDFTEFREAASLFDVPAQNLVYADAQGNIGYQTPGRLPVRGAGDGWMPQPGWESAYDWAGFVPFDDLPVVFNPPEGYIVTANNAILGQERDRLLARDWDHGYRAARIAHLIERRAAAGPLRAQDLREIQMDQEMWIGKRLAVAMEGVALDSGRVREAVELLRSWDAQSRPDSAAAAYANVLWSNLVQNLFVDRDVPAPVTNQGRLFTIVAAMLDDPGHPLWRNDRIDVADRGEMLAFSAAQAHEELSDLQGADVARWNWGSLHALSLTHDSLGTSGIAPIEMLFNRGPYPIGGGSSVVDATGWVLGESYATSTVPSMRMVVDLADLDRSSWIQLTGASGHAFSEHYTDQTAAWSAGEQNPWAFTPDAVTRAAVDTLTLTPSR